MGIANWIERRQHKLEKVYRARTSQRRVLPDFIIIGAQKAGTSSLFHYLSQHPKLHPSFKKEVHYFSGGVQEGVDKFKRGVQWYRSNFPLAKELKADERSFEASPLYIFHPLAPQRMAELVPDARLILLLRNPTERAISHYFHCYKRGMEDLSLSDALHAEEERLAPILAEKDYQNLSFHRHSYKARGLYLDQIQRFLQYYPLENILIQDSSRLFADPHGSLREVCDFVGVESDFKIADLSPRNVGSYESEVGPEVYSYLNDYFAPHNRRLYEFLGRDFGW